MALTFETVAKVAVMNYLKNYMKINVEVMTFELYANGVKKDDFTVPSEDFTVDAAGVLKYTGAAALVFTVPPSTTGVDKIKLKGSFLVSGAQYVSTWTLGVAPIDYRQDFPNGGTFTLGQYNQTVTTE